MAQVLVRGLSEETLAALKKRAQTHQRSLQGEVKIILDDIVDHEKRILRFRKDLEKFRAGFGNRVFSDSTDLIREDRDR
jgi:antitoxin FitA